MIMRVDIIDPLHTCMKQLVARDAAKAETIFQAVESKVEVDNILWCQAVNLSVDNTNSMIEVHISLASHCKGQTRNVYSWMPISPSILLQAMPTMHLHRCQGYMLKTYSLTYQYTIGLIKVRKKGSTSRIHGFHNQEYAKILTHRSTRCIYWRSMLIFSQ